MRHVRRAVAILISFATGLIATATVAHAALTVSDPAVAPADPASTSGVSLWLVLALVALVVLIAAAIVRLGYSRSHSESS
jgi:heme/copper-type cytochrome/quinol oxidase subunit 2